MKPQICVEIGSARGKSACYIAAALKQNGRGKLTAIDPHIETAWNDCESVETFEVMRRNVSELGLEQQINILRLTSEEASRGWEGPIDLLFIDGDHSYEGVKRDWNLFSPHVSQFGMAIFHDTLWDSRPDPRWSRGDMGVPRFVDELRRDGFPVLTIEQDFGVSVVQPKVRGIPLVKDLE